MTDPEGYKPYQGAASAAFSRFGARYLVRGGRYEITEGQARSRTVVVEFPSYDAALACYRSPEYRQAIDLRAGKADFDMVIIEGLRRRLMGASMAKGYWIGRVDVHDEEGYKPYAAANPAIFKKFGARFVVRGGHV